jgi:hypothetical protein
VSVLPMAAILVGLLPAFATPLPVGTGPVGDLAEATR